MKTTPSRIGLVIVNVVAAVFVVFGIAADPEVVAGIAAVVNLLIVLARQISDPETPTLP